MLPLEEHATGLFLLARHRLADSGLRLNPCAGRRSGLERTGERMRGAAHRQADEKTWSVVCARPVLIYDEHHELVYHRVPVAGLRCRATALSLGVSNCRATVSLPTTSAGL